MKNILIIDDEAAVCNMLKKFLTVKGYETTTALSGEEGIERIKKQKPDAVLLDIKMPGMDGIKVLKKIKEIDKDIRLIMITAVDKEKTGRECMDLGADDYITKPLSLDYLENILTIKLSAVENK